MLRGALALDESPGPVDRFALMAGTLNVLAAAADERPLLALIDDAQWLDAASGEALAFVSRRLGSEGIVMLWTSREGDEPSFSLEGIDELHVGGLSAVDAQNLVARVSPGVAPRVAAELAEATGGNPFALLELPGTLSEATLAGRDPLETPLLAGSAVDRAFGRCLADLPSSTRLALGVAAAAETRGLSDLTAAWLGLGVDLSRPPSSREGGLIVLADAQLEFRHPLLRAVAYSSMPGPNSRELLTRRSRMSWRASEGLWHRRCAVRSPTSASPRHR